MTLIKILASAVSGCAVVMSASFDLPEPFAAALACTALIPFLAACLDGRLSCRLASWAAFSVPLILYVGEGMWFSLRYFYEVPFVPSVLIYVVWVWLFSSLHWLLFSLVGYRLRAAVSKAWMLPFLWAAAEFLYSRISLQGRMLSLGHLAPVIPVLSSSARFGGVYAASFMIVLVNTLILCLVYYRGRLGFLKQKGWLFSLAAAALLAVAGAWPSRPVPYSTPLRAALLQPGQQFKVEETGADVQNRLNSLTQLTRQAVRDGASLIVWPASVMILRDLNQIRAVIKSIGSTREKGWSVVLGATVNIREPGNEFHENTLVLTDESGEIRNKYIKQRLTPYTEYAPFSLVDLIGRGKLAIPRFRTSRQTDLVFSVEDKRWGNAVCIEIFYPEILGRTLRRGARFLIHYSNDDIYAFASMKRLLLRVSAFRAMELGVPVLRIAIDGHSAWIDSSGQIVKVLHHAARGVVQAILRSGTHPTVYARVGDVFGWLCVVLTALFYWFGLRRSEFYPPSPDSR